MRLHAAPARPAVPCSAAFLLGIALAETAKAPPQVWALFALAVLVLSLAFRHRASGLTRGLVLLGLLAAGGWRFADAEGRAAGRGGRWPPADERPVELHFEGRVLGAPEATWRGERLLEVRGRPTTRGHWKSSEEVVVRLLVRRSPEEPTAALERLTRGDRIRVWCRLRLPRPRGNPGSHDPVRSLRARGLDAYGTVKSARLVERLEAGAEGPLRWIDRLKRLARRRLDRAFGSSNATRGVLGAMLLGDRAGLDPAHLRALRGSGLIHLLAISGLHVGLAALMLIGSLRRIRVRPLALLLVAGLVFSSLALLVGARPPVLRAVVTTGLLLAGRTVGRDGEPLNTLAVAAATLVAFDPWALGSAAFQLSFLATGGILAMTGPLSRALPFRGLLFGGLAVSISAYLATVPAAAWNFGRLAPIALLTNLVAVPLCAAILCGGTAAMFCVGVPLLGSCVIGLTGLFVRTLLALAWAAASLPQATFAVAAPAPLLLGSYALLLVFALRLARPSDPRFPGRASSEKSEGLRRTLRANRPTGFDDHRRVRARCMRLGIAVCLVLFHLGPPPAGPDGSTEVTVVDVGQAQAVILRGPTGGFALVDAAGTAGGRFDAGERVVGPALRRLGCRRLEVLLLTHEHDDHAGGAAAILREFEVGELWIPPGAHRRPRIRQLAALGRRQGTALVLAERGHRRVRAGIELEVLHPTRNDIQLKTNDRSVVLRTGRAPARALIPGDLESTGESRLLGAGASFAAEALIVGHHGGRRSTTDPWLDGVQPRIAVVSAGAGNRFGHPDPQVLDRLARRQVRVLRTDRHGMVRLSSGPAGWRVRHYRRSESKDDRRSRDERGQEDDEQHQRQ